MSKQNLLDFRGEFRQTIEIDIYEDVEHEEFYTTGILSVFNDVGANGFYLQGDTKEKNLPVTVRVKNEDYSGYFGTTVDYIRFNKKALM